MTFQELLARNGIRLSAEQEAAVYEDRAAVVSAGAGAGKTTVLSLRFVRLVMERKAHSDQIMTLTFTKKAAAEMYERIYRLLGCAAEGDGYLKAEMEERLHSDAFFRCHKSYIINLNHIKDITPYGRWTYVVRLENTKHDALITHEKYEELERMFR